MRLQGLAPFPPLVALRPAPVNLSVVVDVEESMPSGPCVSAMCLLPALGGVEHSAPRHLRRLAIVGDRNGRDGRAVRSHATDARTHAHPNPRRGRSQGPSHELPRGELAFGVGPVGAAAREQNLRTPVLWLHACTHARVSTIVARVWTRGPHHTHSHTTTTIRAGARHGAQGGRGEASGSVGPTLPRRCVVHFFRAPIMSNHHPAGSAAS